MHSNQHPAVMTAYVSTSANAYLWVVKLMANTNAERLTIAVSFLLCMFRYSNTSSLFECTVLVTLREAQGKQHPSPSVKACKCSGKHTEVLLKKDLFCPHLNPLRNWRKNSV